MIISRLGILVCQVCLVFSHDLSLSSWSKSSAECQNVNGWVGTDQKAQNCQIAKEPEMEHAQNQIQDLLDNCGNFLRRMSNGSAISRFGSRPKVIKASILTSTHCYISQRPYYFHIIPVLHLKSYDSFLNFHWHIKYRKLLDCVCCVRIMAISVKDPK